MALLARVDRSIFRLRARYPIFCKMLAGFVGLFLVFSAGIAGYILIEDWNFIDSFYMVVITLSTVGYMEVQPLSEVGRIFTSLLILGGVSIFLYIAGSFAQILVEGRLQILWGKRRMQKMIDTLKDHFIVCGHGRIGKFVAGQIMRDGHQVVVIERDPAIVESLVSDGILHVAGDATSDEVLIAAGLERASSLITALTQEAANVYVTLTARQLNPNIRIIARADSETHISRLERAGADRVVMPHLIGGMRMAQSVLRPTVTNLIELAMRGNLDLSMEELDICADSDLAGKNLMESEIRPRFEVIVIAVRKSDGQMIFNPGPDTVLDTGDTIVVIGKPDKMKKLRESAIGGSHG